MTASPTTHTWMTRMARHMPSSSGLSLPPAKAAPCVLGLLGHARPQVHAAGKAVI
jgi:hypothetical protein